MEIKPESKQNDEASNGFNFLSVKPYVPPSWASHLNPIPTHFSSLGHLPTPIHKWNLPNLPKNTEVWLKRDDLSGMQLSGNQARKLEFLIADALQQGADCIITIGEIQSNHCRATAVAAKYFNLDTYLILHTSKCLVNQDPGLTGNLLVERLVGAHIQLISNEEYAKIGSTVLGDYLKTKLRTEGRNPYVIPVGGSNCLGTWGYIEAVREIERQLDSGNEKIKFDYIVVACGSGGTIAGLSLGSWLSTLKAKIYAFSVCDDPDYFYDSIQGLLDGLHAGVDSHDIVEIQNAKGLGYAINTSEELNFIRKVAESTGVVLDPVYSGKAAYGMMKDMAYDPKWWEGKKVLFIHTGGLLGLYDKADQMGSMLGKWNPMDVNEAYGEWKRLEDSVVLMVHLAGFKKEELRVQIKNSSPELTVSGKRMAAKDEKMIQFKKEIKLRKNIQKDQISAKFSGSVLSITMPKKASAEINFISRFKLISKETAGAVAVAVAGAILALGHFFFVNHSCLIT